MKSKRRDKEETIEESKAPYTILVAEDDEGLALLIEKKVHGAGFCTARGSNGAESIAWVVDHPDALLLLDYRLPDMTGKQVVERLVQKQCRAPFIIITGHGDEKVAVEMMKLGARDYLIKEEGFLDLLPSVVTRVVGQLVTEKELANAQEALWESEEKYRNVVERASDGIAIIQDTLFTYVNQRFAEIGGYAVEELVGTPFTDFVHPDDLCKIVDYYNRRMAGEDVVPMYELAIRGRDGGKIYVEANAGMIIYQRNPADLVIIRDIADRKGAEEELRESEKRFRVLFENTPLGYQSLSEDGDIVEVNRTWLDLLGYSRDEVIGHWFGDFLAPAYRDFFKENFSNFKATGSVQGVEFEMLRKDGSTIIISLNGKIGYDEQGRFSRTYCIIHDITERKQAEEAIRRHSEELAALLDVSQALSSTLELGTVLQTATESAARVMRLDRAAIYMRELDPSVSSGRALMRLWAAVPRDDLNGPEEVVRVPLDDHPHMREAVSTGHVVVLADTKSSELAPAERDIVDTLGLRSLLIVPLMVGKRTLGTLHLGAVSELTVFSESEIDLSRTLGNLVAVAIENAKLFEEVNLEHQKLEKIVDGVGGGLSLIDRDFTVLWANKYLTDIYGSLEELVGKPCYEVYFERNEVCDVCACRESMKSGRIETEEKLVNSGEARWYQLTSAPITDTEGNVVQVLELVQDITERKQADEELKERMEELEKFRRVTVGRELKMIELKEKIKSLEKKIKQTAMGGK